ncbi:MAG: cupin domain-containing protein [candidate division NC10 bacterium]|nr:cupin domain-containing protein [candidate division NC10 bacterium]
MKRAALLLGLTLAVGIAVGMIGTHVLHAQQPSMKRTPIFTTNLEGLPGKEGTMFLAEYEPGARSGKHYHPGHEFIYVMEGSGVMEEVGKLPVDMKPGVAFYFLSSPDKPSYVHEARNLSTTEPMKLLVVLITDKGQPLAYPLK